MCGSRATRTRSRAITEDDTDRVKACKYAPADSAGDAGGNLPGVLPALRHLTRNELVLVDDRNISGEPTSGLEPLTCSSHE
jgi:hypothetical protein